MDYNVIVCDWLPCSIHGMTVYSYDSDGCPWYTIFLNAKINREMQEETYKHELAHIENNDFDYMLPVEDLEAVRHGIA